jgi:polyhydroxybutyrate depolymerase
MRYPIRLWLAFVLGAATFVAGPFAEELRIETGDGVRTTIVMPVRQGPAPTLLVLHGATISADLTARWSGFAEIAAERGFAAAFPEGIYRLWNDGRNDGLANADDVGYLRQLAGKLVEQGTADPARIYLVGISSGGMMTLRMLCEAPEQFAGAATVIANMPALVGADCRLHKAVPIVMLNGTADPIVPYKGGDVGLTGRYGKVWSAERTAAFLARGNGCTKGPSERPLGGSVREGRVHVTLLDWSACGSGQSVAFYRIEGGGHQLFGQTNILPAILGPGTDLVSAPEAVMAVFAKE